MKIRDVVKLLMDHGFVLDRQKRRHRQYEGMVGGKRRLVTIAGRPGDDIAPPTLSSIKRQSGLPGRLFR